MLFVKEENGLRYTYSDTFQIRQVQTGAIYDAAWDRLDAPYTYEETDIPLESEEEITNETT